MYLKLDNFTDFELSINRAYKDREAKDDRWCKVTLRIENEYIHYKIDNKEVLIEYEIENLIRELYKLLNGELEEDSKMEFCEPDLEFILSPSNAVPSNVLVDMRINFFEDGVLSANFYNLCLARDQIELILIYLNNVIPTVDTSKLLNEYEQKKNSEIGRNGKYKCPCCEYYTLDEVGHYDICPICYWEDDPIQRDDADYKGGANEICLNEAKKNYKDFSAIERKYIDNVRLPVLSETIFYHKYKNEDEICNTLFNGKKEEIEKIMKDLKIEYYFYDKIKKYNIKIRLLGITKQGKMNKGSNYNCINYFGYTASYKNF